MSLKAIILDSREADWVKALTFDVPMTVQSLPYADAWLATGDATLLVERKTVGDLLGSIADGRIFDQVARMVDASAWCYVVVTELPAVRSGYVWLQNRITKWKWASVQGALATVQEMGATVLFLENYGAYGPVLELLARRSREEVRIGRKREGVFATPGEIVLSSLPGISVVRAQALLDHCGSAAWALAYLTDGGEDIPGVGPATRKAARGALGLDDELTLTVISREGQNGQ